jgi:hypothetical protein
MTTTDITAELARAMGLLAGDLPDRLDRAREAIQRALEMLDAERAKSTVWTVEEILDREG